MLLKENAIDCELFKSINAITKNDVPVDKALRGAINSELISALGRYEQAKKEDVEFKAVIAKQVHVCRAGRRSLVIQERHAEDHEPNHR